jgi:hypothetical protein
LFLVSLDGFLVALSNLVGMSPTPYEIARALEAKINVQFRIYKEHVGSNIYKRIYME